MYSVSRFSCLKRKSKFNFRGLIIYDEDDPIPSISLSMELKLPCQQTKYDEDLFSDRLESIDSPDISDIRSMQSQSFIQSYYS